MSRTTVSTFRRRVGVGSIVAFFVALLTATALEPTDSHTNAGQLQAAAAHAARMQASAWLEIVAGVLAPVVVLTLMHAIRDRGRRLAHIGATLGLAGAVGMTFIGLHQLFIVALAQRGGAGAGAVLDRLDHLAPAVVALFFAMPVGLVVLAAAAVRAGLATRLVLAGALLFLVIDMVPVPAAEIVQLTLGLVTFASIGRSILATTDAQWTGQATASQPGAVQPTQTAALA